MPVDLDIKTEDRTDNANKRKSGSTRGKTNHPRSDKTYPAGSDKAYAAGINKTYKTGTSRAYGAAESDKKDRSGRENKRANEKAKAERLILSVCAVICVAAFGFFLKQKSDESKLVYSGIGETVEERIAETASLQRELFMYPRYDSDGNAVSDKPVNINTADAAELQTLDGIGEKKAAAIIEYREQHGGFSSVDELAEVPGIGEKTLDKLRGKITVEDEKPLASE